MPASPVTRASKMRSNVKIEMSPLAMAAPAKACLAGTPTTIIGGAIMIVRATVHPRSRIPEPLSRSRTRAAVRYVGRDAGWDIAPDSTKGTP